ncbi:hypothetical protein GCM10023063_18420 [Arthrobacter methylotrophus]|uniref:FHA domain-containing protein n=1 Tax=Arthrobacter methylotrophus TaxID=121291 RepID=A0ABV5UPB8_9MICC
MGLGFAIVVIIFVVLPLSLAWTYFHHVGRLHNLTTWDAARNYIRRDLDAGPLTPGRIRFTYRGKMRGTGIRGPSGAFMHVRKITVEMPQEDFDFIQQFGLKEFTDQLAAYRHRFALQQGWLSPDEDEVPVSAWPNIQLKRLRPRISYEVAQDGTTKRMTDPDDLFRGATTERLGGVLTVNFEDQQWSLHPEHSPYALGRSIGNAIRTVHPHISAHQADIVYSDGTWTLLPQDTTNATKVDGIVATGPTPLTSDSTITVGASGPIEIRLGT